MPIELRAGDARVLLSPQTGGAIASFSHRGRDVLRPTPPGARDDVRAHACYPLAPYSNRIANARLAFAGRTYPLARNFGDHPHAIHGVGWQRSWRVVDADGASARIALDHRPAGDDARAWPWPFDAWQSLALAHDGERALLTATLGLRNVGDAPFPFGLGWHPYFPRGDAAALGFRASGVWTTDATKLPVERVGADGGFSFEPPRPIGSTVLDNVYCGWDGEARLVEPNGGRTTIAADRACAFLVVYAPGRMPFVALEPVTHMTDAFNRAARGDAATGTRTLEPGAAFSCTMQIASLPPS